MSNMARYVAFCDGLHGNQWLSFDPSCDSEVEYGYWFMRGWACKTIGEGC